jgi:hypothetical protein
MCVPHALIGLVTNITGLLRQYYQLAQEMLRKLSLTSGLGTFLDFEAYSGTIADHNSDRSVINASATAYPRCSTLRNKDKTSCMS